MYIDIEKPAIRYVIALIEKRMAVLKNRLLKENKDDWYDYDGAQLETKICDASPEYYRLFTTISKLHIANDSN